MALCPRIRSQMPPGWSHMAQHSASVTDHKYDISLGCVVPCLVTGSLIRHLGQLRVLLLISLLTAKEWVKICSCFSNPTAETAREEGVSLSDSGTRRQLWLWLSCSFSLLIPRSHAQQVARPLPSQTEHRATPCNATFIGFNYIPRPHLLKFYLLPMKF